MKEETRSTLYHDKIAEEYESSHSQPYWQLYFEVTWHFLKKYLPPNKNAKILDAGGGTGYWSRKLATLGYDLICTDIARNMLEVGKRLAKAENLEDKILFHHADILDMKEYEENSFDMVIAQGDSVGYCGNSLQALKELARVVKKGGHVAVSIDSFYARVGILLAMKEYTQLDKLLKTHISDFTDGFPQYNFTVEELKLMFEKNGLQVLEVIGKPVFENFIPREKINELLSDEDFFRKILEIELKFNNQSSIIGLSGHLQMIGKK